MWKRLTESDLAGQLSQKEIDAFKQSESVEGNDPIEAILANTALLVRAYIRKSGSVSLSADALAVPGSLVSAALDYAAYDLLKRINVPINAARTKAREEARELFEMVRKGELLVEPDGEENVLTSSPATPVTLDPKPPRILD